MAARRPFQDAAALADAAGAAVRELTWPQVLEALAAHPRIGERARGPAKESAWSRQEQSGVEEELRAALAEGNQAYERRFGHVYLICATGLTGGEMLAAAARATGRRRGGRAAHGPRGAREDHPAARRQAGGGGRMSFSTHVLDAVTGRPAAGVPVRLEHARPGGRRGAHRRATAGSRGWEPEAGVHRLVFDTGGYLGGRLLSPRSSSPSPSTDPGEHYHVPLLLSPYAYSTYRGS